ncbi:MAG: calcium-binding protein [Verrucomicrobiales bacterium]
MSLIEPITPRKPTNQIHEPTTMKRTTLPLVLAAIAAISLQDVSAHRGLSRADTDGDGVVSEEEKEVAQAAREEAKAAREEARQAIIDEFDADEDGVLNEEERAAAKEAKEAEREAAKTERYGEIDADEDGAVTQEELEAAMPEVDAERVAALLGRYDADENGTVSLEEFLNPVRPDKRGRFVSKRAQKQKGPNRRRGRAIIRRGGFGGKAGGGVEAPAPEALQ